MRKQSATVVWMFFVIVAMVGAHASVAGADQQVTAHVPFAFIVGESRLPAGDYIVKERDSDFLARVVRDDGDEQDIVLTPAIMEREVATAR